MVLFGIALPAMGDIIIAVVTTVPGDALSIASSVGSVGISGLGLLL